MFDTCVGPDTGNTVVVSFMMLNTKEAPATSLSLSFAETPSIEIPGLDGSSLPVPFELPAGMSQDFRFELKPDSSEAPLSVSGELKFSVGDEEVTQPFTLPLPVSTFTYPNVMSDTQFAEMVGGGSLEAKHSISCPTANAPFETVLRFVVCSLHLTVIEANPGEGAASLAGKSTAGENVCLLLKCAEGAAEFTLAGKSEQEGRLVSIMTELVENWTIACAAAEGGAAADAAQSPDAASGAAKSPEAATKSPEAAKSPEAEAVPETAADLTQATEPPEDEDEFKEANGEPTAAETEA